jgi:pyruvate,water dikinase
MIAVSTHKKHKNQNFIRLKGVIAFPRDTSGEAFILQGSNKKKFKDKFILIAEATYPEYLPIMLKSSGIVTEVGGILSHAAIVAREFSIPCVVGVKGATSKIKEGDQVIIRKNGVVLVKHKRE